jgi:phenylacetate-CoA ligase
MLVVRGVNVFPSQIETVLLRVSGVEPYYQIIVDRSAHYMDELEVWVEVATDTYGHHDRVIQLEQRLREEIRSALGITCHVTLVGPRALERSEGKAVRVVDKRTL